MEYCEFGSSLTRCKEWLKEENEALYNKFYSEGVSFVLSSNGDLGFAVDGGGFGGAMGKKEKLNWNFGCRGAASEDWNVEFRGAGEARERYGKEGGEGGGEG